MLSFEYIENRQRKRWRFFVCAPGMARSAVTGAVLQLWWLKND
ncbi:putative membrane protein [Escherichia coli 1-392-07_S4_C1]|uniref:Putative membrane protein n=1 Tax=Escherichia coli 2-460-02_S1_C1 TaxID=1444044 RepID=A0A836NGH0_ECOLX|nr:putative membrane protein [Escherichia coli 2-427-07_S4_C3]KEJ64926.1 putative membrane protein [Escherichia coli 3-267-03_S4_C1]KEN73359.1 putative membrane protein [Escherichia coli 1-392-07_S4_C3]KEO03639.1 putative membrane protein [Escherichia coli 1-392-07_S4_C1]KEO33725.1 putative membrane protein [Escherichia coli 2-460-02_S1_C1]